MKNSIFTKLSRTNIKAYIACFVLAILLSGCNGGAAPALADGGPTAWVEYPFDGETLPMAPITLIVYAADSAGVDAINVKVNGVALPVGQLNALTTDGSSRLVRVDHSWQPPAEGEYIVEADAGSAPVSVTFCVVTCNPEEEVQTGPTPTDTATLPFITLPPEGATDTPTPDTESQVEFWAAPPYINEGECTTLNWNVSGAQTVYYEGGKVASSGSQQECPAESRDYQLQVVGTDSGTTDYWTSVEVYEVDEPLPPTNTPTNTSPPPPPKPPTDTPTPTEEPPPADTSGPSINWTTLVWEDCRAFGQAEITDESGVSQATFYYNKNGEGWNGVWMQEISADLWESEVGVPVDDGMGTPEGTLEYYVVASDTLGNESESATTTYEYVGCGGGEY